MPNRLPPNTRADSELILYAARASVWGRWFLSLFCAFQLAYRSGFWYPSDIEYVYLHVPLVVLNGLVHYRLLTKRAVTWRWLFALSAMDFVLITASIVIGGGFGSFIFPAYYAALAIFAVLFTSLGFVLT